MIDVAKAGNGPRMVALEKALPGLASADLDGRGNTALHYIAAAPDVSASEEAIAQLAIENVNVDARDNRGNTPLHISSYMGKIHQVRALMQSGARVDVKNDDDETPTSQCCKSFLACDEGEKAAILALLNNPSTANPEAVEMVDGTFDISELSGGGIQEITLYRSMVPIPVGNVEESFGESRTHGNTEGYVYFASEEEARQFERPMFSVKFEDIMGKDRMSLRSFANHPLYRNGVAAAEKHRAVNLYNLKRLLTLLTLAGKTPNPRLGAILRKNLLKARTSWRAFFEDTDSEALREKAKKCQRALSIAHKIQNIFKMWKQADEA